MKIQCQDHPVEFILQSNYFEIPRFQRPYSWDKENWEDFWNDVFLTKHDDYFIGSIVTFAKGQYKAIVDGQQRLTTITLVLAAIRNSYRQLNLNDRAAGVQNFIERNNKNNEATFVLKTETSYPYLQTSIQRDQPQFAAKTLSEEELLLQTAFSFFFDKVQQEVQKVQDAGADSTKRTRCRNRLDEIRDSLLALKLIYVELDNEDDAYQVFETLNTRGKDLASTDLLKNHLARLLRERNPQSDDVKVRWSIMSDNIKAISAEGVDLDGFLYHYWLSTNSFVRKRDIFKVIRETVKTKVTAKKLLDDLLAFSEIYRDIHEPAMRKWRNDELEIKSTLEAINRMRVTHPIPLIMSIMYKYHHRTMPKIELMKLLHVVETFTFINTSLMNARSSGGVAQMYAFHAKTLASSTETGRRQRAANEFIDKLKAKLPNKVEYLEKFQALKYSDKHTLQKREIQYVVTNVFSSMFPAVAVNPFEMSIEHIEPQSSNVLSHDEIASIGNLWFLKTAFNNQLGNQPAAVKLTKYKNSQLPCDSTLSNATSWGNIEINNRTSELAEHFWDSSSLRFATSGY